MSFISPITIGLSLFVLVLSSTSTSAGQPAGDYVIGPHDVLAIQVFDQTDLGGKYTVETDGTFSFPLIGRVTAAGMSFRKVENEAQKKIAGRDFRKPQGRGSGRPYPG